MLVPCFATHLLWESYRSMLLASSGTLMVDDGGREKSSNREDQIFSWATLPRNGSQSTKPPSLLHSCTILLHCDSCICRSLDNVKSTATKGQKGSPGVPAFFTGLLFGRLDLDTVGTGLQVHAASVSGFGFIFQCRRQSARK